MSVVYQVQVIDTMNQKYKGVEKKLVHFDDIFYACEYSYTNKYGYQCKLEENFNPGADQSCLACFCPLCCETETEDHVEVYREAKK